jgi:hypothetical protein
MVEVFIRSLPHIFLSFMGYLFPPNGENLLGHSLTEKRCWETELTLLEESLFEDIMFILPSNERTLFVKSFSRC